MKENVDVKHMRKKFFAIYDDRARERGKSFERKIYCDFSYSLSRKKSKE